MKNISYLWQDLVYRLGGGGQGAKGPGGGVSVLGNYTKCIDCDIRVSVVPPGALVLIGIQQESCKEYLDQKLAVLDLYLQIYGQFSNFVHKLS